MLVDGQHFVEADFVLDLHAQLLQAVGLELVGEVVLVLAEVLQVLLLLLLLAGVAVLLLRLPLLPLLPHLLHHAHHRLPHHLALQYLVHRRPLLRVLLQHVLHQLLQRLRVLARELRHLPTHDLYEQSFNCYRNSKFVTVTEMDLLFASNACLKHIISYKMQPKLQISDF